MGSQFNIPHIDTNLKWELKKYAVFHKTTMYKVVIEAIKEKISYEEPGYKE